jgi:WhiB family redox-sensing transcriptional regulator
VITDGPTELFSLKPEPWTERALCREIGAELFFVEKGESYVTGLAKRVCNGTKEIAPCPVRESCLTWALEINDQHAVLGGTSPRQRRKLATERRAAS